MNNRDTRETIRDHTYNMFSNASKQINNDVIKHIDTLASDNAIVVETICNSNVTLFVRKHTKLKTRKGE